MDTKLIGMWIGFVIGNLLAWPITAAVQEPLGFMPTLALCLATAFFMMALFAWLWSH